MPSLHAVLLDLGGVFYEGTRLIPGAAEALAPLRGSGLPLRFVTNTTRQSRAALLRELAGRGLAIAQDELFTPASAARELLIARGLRPLLLIHPDLAPDFAGLDTAEPNAVVVGDAGEYFRYATLNQAFRLIHGGAPLLALGRNRYFQEADGLSLDAGPFVRRIGIRLRQDRRAAGQARTGYLPRHARFCRLPCRRSRDDRRRRRLRRQRRHRGGPSRHSGQDRQVPAGGRVVSQTRRRGGRRHRCGDDRSAAIKGSVFVTRPR